MTEAIPMTIPPTQPPSGRMPMPDTNTVLMPPAQPVADDGPKSLGDISGWAKFVGKLTLEKLFAFAMCGIAGWLLYDMHTERQFDRTDRQNAIAADLRVKQEEGEKNRQSQEAMERANRQTMEMNAKLSHSDTVSLIQAITRLENQFHRIEMKLDKNEESPLCPDKRAFPDAHLPRHGSGPGLSIVYDLDDAAR